MTTKTCAKCDAEKPLGEYHRDRTRPDGKRPYCKPCVSEYASAYYDANCDDILEKRYRYRQEHPERIAEQKRRYYQASREETA